MASPSGGKLGRLRRIRVGALSVPVRTTELIRGPKVRSALKLKAILARRAPAPDQYTDHDTYEPPMRRERPSEVARKVSGVGMLGNQFDGCDDDDE